MMESSTPQKDDVRHGIPPPVDVPNFIWGSLMFGLGLFILIYGFINGYPLYPAGGLVLIGAYLVGRSRFGRRRRRLNSK